MPSEVSYHDLKTWLAGFGVVCRKKPSGHVSLRREVNGQTLTYPIPLISGRRVLPVYIRKLRRALWLDSEHDVADDQCPFHTAPAKPKNKTKKVTRARQGKKR